MNYVISLLLLISLPCLVYGKGDADVFRLLRPPSADEGHPFFHLVRYPTEGIYLIDINPKKHNSIPMECELAYSIDGANWSTPKQIGNATDGGLPHYQVLSAQFSGKITIAQGVNIPEFDVASEVKRNFVDGQLPRGLFIRFLLHIYSLDAASGELTHLKILSDVITVVEQEGKLQWEKVP